MCRKRRYLGHNLGYDLKDIVLGYIGLGYILLSNNFKHIKSFNINLFAYIPQEKINAP